MGVYIYIYIERETIKPINRPAAPLPGGSGHLHGHPRPCCLAASQEQRVLTRRRQQPSPHQVAPALVRRHERYTPAERGLFGPSDALVHST